MLRFLLIFGALLFVFLGWLPYITIMFALPVEETLRFGLGVFITAVFSIVAGIGSLDL